MKIGLFMILCSAVAGECMPAFHLDTLNSHYECLQKGYEESNKKIKEIGRDEVNKSIIVIKFTCEPIKTMES